MDFDFGAQDVHRSSEFIRAYHELFQTYASEQMDLPWYLTPRVEWKRRQLAKRVRSTLEEIVRNTFANRQTQTTKSRSILSLSLQYYANELTAKAVSEACDQLSTLGHDTTSILLHGCSMSCLVRRMPFELYVLSSTSSLAKVGIGLPVSRTTTTTPFPDLWITNREVR